MCDFITAILPRNVDVPAIVAVFERHKIGFSQTHNERLSRQIAPGDILILTTRDGCDCGTPLGSLAESDIHDSCDSEAQIAKFRKQGWSEAKIQRWREQKGVGREKQDRDRQTRAGTRSWEIEHWIPFLMDVLRSGHTDRIGLLLHYYRGTLGNEHIQIERQEFVSLEHLTIDQLLHIHSDVVYNYVL